MQLKTPLKDWAVGMQKRLECEYACSKSILDHSVSIGTIREIVVRDILRAFLPVSVEIGSGQIMDLEGNLSSQVDNRYFDMLKALGADHPINSKDYLVWKIPMDDSSEGELIQMNKSEGP